MRVNVNKTFDLHPNTLVVITINRSGRTVNNYSVTFRDRDTLKSLEWFRAKPNSEPLIYNEGTFPADKEAGT